MRLKTMKEQPLLTPPKEVVPWIPSQRDFQAIDEAIAEYRREGDIQKLLEIAYYLNKLGGNIRLIEEEKKQANTGLESERHESTKRGEYIAPMLHHMRALGIYREASGDDIRRLREARTFFGKIPSWMGAAMIVYYLGEFGQNGDLKPKERDGLIAVVQSARERRNGYDLSLTLFLSKRFGIQETVTDDDRRIMVDELTKHRVASHGLGIARMCFLMQEIMPQREAEHPHMPPLKRFGRSDR